MPTPLAAPAKLLALPAVEPPSGVLRDTKYSILSLWRSQIKAGYFLDTQFNPDLSPEFLKKRKLHWVDGNVWHDQTIVVPDTGDLSKANT